MSLKIVAFATAEILYCVIIYDTQITSALAKNEY